MIIFITAAIGFLAGAGTCFLLMRRKTTLFEKRSTLFKEIQRVEHTFYAFDGTKECTRDKANALLNDFQSLITEAALLFNADVARDLENVLTEADDCFVYACRLYEASVDENAPYAAPDQKKKQAALYRNAVKKLAFSFFCAYRDMSRL